MTDVTPSYITALPEADVRAWRQTPRLPLLVGAGADRPAADRAARRARYFWEYDGTRYLDFSSQLVNVNIGYQHPKLVAAIQEQAGAALHDRAVVRQRRAQRGSRGSSPSIAPGDLNQVFFTNGGAEANENAVRMARLHTGRHKVLLGLPQLSRRDRRRDHADRRAAALGRRARHAGRRALLGSVPLSLRVPRRRPRRRSASGRCSTCAT